MIEIHLFGDLQRYATDPLPLPGTVLHIQENQAQTVGQILTQVGIAPEEVSHVFLNGRLLPRSAYPMTLGYPLAADKALTLEGCLAAPVQSGDRVGIFPRKMGVVVV